MTPAPRICVGYIRQYHSTARTHAERQEIAELQAAEIDAFGARNGILVERTFKERPVNRRSRDDRRAKLQDAIRRCRELGPTCMLVYVDLGERYADEALRAVLTSEVEDNDSPLTIEVIRNPSQSLADLLTRRRNALADVARHKAKSERKRRAKITAGVKAAIKDGRLDTEKARMAATKSRRDAADDAALSITTKIGFIDTMKPNAKVERFCRIWNKKGWGIDRNFQITPSGRRIRMTPARLTWLLIKQSERDDPGGAAMLRQRGVGRRGLSQAELAAYLNRIKLPKPSGKTSGWTKTDIRLARDRAKTVTNKSKPSMKT